MARLFLLHDESPGVDLVDLVTSAFAASRERGIDHLSVRIDVADARAFKRSRTPAFA